jgi:hypothetical protein
LSIASARSLGTLIVKPAMFAAGIIPDPGEIASVADHARQLFTLSR